MIFISWSSGLAVSTFMLASSSHASPLYAGEISFTSSCALTTPITLFLSITGSMCVSAAAISLQISLISVLSFSVGTKKVVLDFERFLVMLPTFILAGSILLVNRNLFAAMPLYFLPSNTTAECIFAFFILPSMCEIVSLTSIET